MAGERVMRPPTAADMAAVADIWHAGWRDGHVGYVPNEVLPHRDLASFHARAPLRVADTSVLVIDGEVAGFVMTVDDEAEQVYLDAAHRGSDAAAMLLAEAERRIRADGHAIAWLAVVPGNERARRFYERMGWVDRGRYVHTAATLTGTVDMPCHRYDRKL